MTRKIRHFVFPIFVAILLTWGTLAALAKERNSSSLLNSNLYKSQLLSPAAPQNGYREARMLAALVSAGELPPSKERLPVADGFVNSVVGVGESGLSFRYVDTFGETEVAYPADADHLNYPYGVGLDGTGNLWVAEYHGVRAMKYAYDGTFQNSIGTAGLIGRVDEYHFNNLSDVAVDNAGNVWIVDTSPSWVAKYDAAGNFLGQLGVTWVSGTDNGHFYGPKSIAFDSYGNIYVSDSNNHRIQIFDNTGTYSETLGVTGVVGSDNAHFNDPIHITIDGSDHLYVADSGNHRVQIFDQDLNFLNTIGVATVSGSDEGHLTWPMGVAVDGSHIYVADGGNHRIQIFNIGTYAYQATIGSGSPGSSNDQFFYPTDVAVDSSGNLFVADQENQRIQMFNGGQIYQRTFGTTGVPYLTDGYHYNEPVDVAIDPAGNIGLVEGEGPGCRFVKLDANGDPLLTIGEAGVCGSDNAHLYNPSGVAFDGVGNIYIADRTNDRIQIFDGGGTYSTTLGSGLGIGAYEFNHPEGVAIDTNGNIYVADSENQRVQIYDRNRIYQATIGQTGTRGSDNDHFNQPLDVFVDTNGLIYVADALNSRVQVFNTNFVYSYTLGTAGEWGEDFNHFSNPADVVVDSDLNVYVADRYNSRVQVFDRNGAYLTSIGGVSGINSGNFNEPTGIDLDRDGNVYVADHHNQRIQKFTPGVPYWTQANINGFGDRWNGGVSALEVFSNTLYAGTSNWVNGGRIWKSTDGKNWNPASEYGVGSGYEEMNRGIIDMIEFDGQLYVGTGWGGYPGQIWRSPDGITWDQMVGDGFGNVDNYAVIRFAVYNNLLYAATGNDLGTEIWRSASGDLGDWQMVLSAGNGDPDNNTLSSFTVYAGSLYAAVQNENVGAQVWMSTGGETWSQVNNNGFGDAENIHIGSILVFSNTLYAATRNDTTGAQIWGSNNGTDWYQVMGDGFGNPENMKIESLYIYNGYLFAASDNNEPGMEVWRSSDGISWEQVNIGGFGDCNNNSTLWNNATTVFKDQLYYGTWNGANGGEIWHYTPQLIFLPLVVR